MLVFFSNLTNYTDVEINKLIYVDLYNSYNVCFYTKTSVEIIMPES